MSTEVVYLQRRHGWCHMKLLPSRRVLCTPCHFMQSHIRKVFVCLAVTCHLHLWQNDRGLLRATAVTRGWNGYRNKSQHRKLTMEKKILPPLQQGFEPATFRSRVRRSNHRAIPPPPPPHTHTLHTHTHTHTNGTCPIPFKLIVFFFSWPNKMHEHWPRSEDGLSVS